MNYRFTQAQYARIYGVTQRSIRTYQGQELPLDDVGKTLLSLMDRKTRPPGLSSPEMARARYDQVAGVASKYQVEQLDALLWKFWEAHTEIVVFVRKHNWRNAEEIAAVVSGVSGMKQTMHALAGLPESDHADAAQD